MNLALIQNRKIKIAVVGLGRISSNHLTAIQQFKDDLDLVAVCDIHKPTTDTMADTYNTQGFYDLEVLLKSGLCDVVVLCTPSGYHPPQAILCAKYKVSVITEKPMATRYADGIKMFDACCNAPVRLFVVKQNRFNATLQLLKQAIDNNRFGQINMVHINVFWTRPQQYYDTADWRGTYAMDGGAFMNQASHYVDLLSYLFGEVAKVHAFTATRERTIEAEDTGVINIQWQSGTLGSMAVTMLTYPKNFEGSLTVLGTNGTVRIGGVAINEIQHWDFADTQEYDAKIDDATYATTSVYGFGHPHYYSNVIGVFRGTEKPLVDGQQGLQSLQILDSIYQSAHTGLPVSLTKN